MQAILHQSKDDYTTSELRSRPRRSEQAVVDYKESDSESTGNCSYLLIPSLGGKCYVLHTLRFLHFFTFKNIDFYAERHYLASKDAC